MPEILLKIIVCIFASLFAGLGTGFIGMSAAVSITPFLMTFLGVSHFDAVAISLASDVLASFVGFLLYKKSKNVDLKNGLILLILILIFTFVGTICGWLAENYFGTTTMWYGTVISITAMGIKLIFFPKTKLVEDEEMTSRRKIVISIVFGAIIGFVCGFVGAGGGMLMLIALTVFLGYDLHKAVGTSLLIMSLTSLIGGIFHIIFEGVTVGFNASNMDYLVLVFCVIFTLVFSIVGSIISNKISDKKLNFISGIMLLIISAVVIVFNVLWLWKKRRIELYLKGITSGGNFILQLFGLWRFYLVISEKINFIWKRDNLTLSFQITSAMLMVY